MFKYVMILEIRPAKKLSKVKLLWLTYLRAMILQHRAF